LVRRKQRTINAALLELIYENPAKAEAYTRAAMSLRQQHRPENLTRSSSRALILAHVADEKGKSVPNPGAPYEEAVTGKNALLLVADSAKAKPKKGKAK
jgi:hypothetical protein